MKVLLVDDSPDIAETLSFILEVRWPGTQLVTATDGEEGVRKLEAERPDLVILDVGLPGANGYAVCQEIRQRSAVPIIMLTVRSQDVDIARGLESGADDFVTKPFSHLELMARIHAVLRRTRTNAPVTPQDEPFVSRDVKVDFATREVWVRGAPIRLTPIEFNILRALVTRAGRVVNQRQLLEDVWGAGAPDAARHLRVHVQHLRQKLGDDPSQPRLIATEWRVGYRFMQVPVSNGVRSGTSIRQLQPA
jgi:DNA-binding response OmpR family regulator